MDGTLHAVPLADAARVRLTDSRLAGSRPGRGIDGQLAVLDDAGLTGTGRSSADVLGVPGIVLAGRLTRYLVREIIVCGSGGGPLTPLADQFNHELTRLQVRRIGECSPGWPGRSGTCRPGRTAM